MSDEGIRQNMLGTAFNVLLEMKHPDMKEFERILIEGRPREGVSFQQFDLRYRNLNGDRI